MFGSSAMAGASMMQSGFSRGADTVQSFSNPAASYEPHYGMIQAQTSLNQEWAAYQRGPVGVVGITPPGVGAGEYSNLLQKNFQERMRDVTSGFIKGAAPIVADFAAFPIGSALGVRGAALFGAKGAIGGFVGGMLGGMGTSMLASHIVEKGIQRGDQINAEVNQLGEIATAGRGMTVAQNQEYGMGFRNMAERMGISKNEMGDIASTIRASGMMPRTNDIKASLSQFEGMAKDIRDISAGMQTSIATATRYLKEVERLGMGRGSGGVFAASQMAEGLGTSLSGLIGHVSMGQSVGNAAQIGPGVGGGVFLQSAFAGARGLGSLQGPEQLMVGGAMGLGRAFGMNAMQNALGPMGEMQLMAMMGPKGAQGLPGTMMGTLGQAAGNIFGGGDPVSNMLEFSTNRKRMLRQLGATGIRQMQAHAISGEAQMMQQMFPKMGQQKALQYVAMQKGLNEHQARAMSGYIMRGFKDMGPSSTVSGMPAVFGSERTAQMAQRAAYDSAARSIAVADRKSNMGIIDRGAEWIGQKWNQYKMWQQREAEENRTQRMSDLGFPKISNEAMGAVTQAMRTGRGSTYNASLALSSGPASNQLRSAISFAGGSLGGMVKISDVRGRLMSLARNIHKSTRLGSSGEAQVNEAALHISKSLDDGSLNGKKTAENIAANITKVTKGGGMSYHHRKNLRYDISQILKGTKFEGEFNKVGFAGSRGAAMMKVVDRFMAGQGKAGFSMAKTIQQQAQRGMGAAAYALDVGESSAIRSLAGKAGVDKLAAQIAKKKWEDSRDVGTQLLKEGGTSQKPGWGFLKDYERVERIEREKALLMKGAAADTGLKKTTEIFRTREFQEVVKARHQMYHRPFAKAADKLIADPKYQKASLGQQLVMMAKGAAAADKEKPDAKDAKVAKLAEDKLMKSRALKLDGSSKTASAMLARMGPDSDGKSLTRKLADYTGIANAKGRNARRASGKRKSRGRVVSFQSQAQSFQSQVAQAIRKTGHTLDAIRGAMSKMEGRLAKRKPGE